MLYIHIPSGSITIVSSFYNFSQITKKKEKKKESKIQRMTYVGVELANEAGEIAVLEVTR